ncbi:hypothetical protein DRO51_02010, partial [Candidatus Bathyarchaeota archaeon]
VKVLLEAGSVSLESSAILNSGYEAEVPEVAIPLKIAKKLKLSLKRAKKEKYGTVGPSIQVRRIPNTLKVYLKTEDKTVGPIISDAIILSSSGEVLINDKLIDELGIVIEKPGEGLWRFKDDPPTKIRKSVKIEKW